jgi:hypothetical protein
MRRRVYNDDDDDVHDDDVHDDEDEDDDEDDDDDNDDDDVHDDDVHDNDDDDEDEDDDEDDDDDNDDDVYLIGLFDCYCVSSHLRKLRKIKTELQHGSGLHNLSIYTFFMKI